LDGSNDFDSHESDLYVRHSTQVMNWLVRNYEYYYNLRFFTSPIDNKIWIEIPFANMQWWENRIKTNVTVDPK
jgi:hypothetical protein